MERIINTSINRITPAKIVIRHYKVKKSHDKAENKSNQLFSTVPSWATSSQPLDLRQSSLKTKMRPNGTNKLRKSSSLPLLFSGFIESNSQKRSKNLKIDSTSNTTKGPNLFLIIFAIIIGISALVGFAIAIYTFTYITRTLTTTASTTTSTTFTLRWQSTGMTVAGLGSPATAASDRFYNPYGIAIESPNTFYVVDYGNHRIQKFMIGNLIGTTVAGQPSGISGSTANDLNYPTNVLLDSSGNLYVSDSGNHRVQLFSNGSTAGTTVAGTGVNGSSINESSNPRGLARNSISGALYIADYDNNRVMSYLSGVPTVVAGGNGSGTSNTQLNSPNGLAFDSSSNSLYIVNYASHNVVRWVLGASSWTLVARSPAGSAGYTSTMLYYPIGLALDAMGNIYVADYYSQRIQLFMRGKVNGTTIAGVTSVAGNQPHLLYNPYGVALDSDFNLYVVDRSNQRIQKFFRY